MLTNVRPAKGPHDSKGSRLADLVIGDCVLVFHRHAPHRSRPRSDVLDEPLPPTWDFYRSCNGNNVEEKGFFDFVRLLAGVREVSWLEGAIEQSALVRPDEVSNHDNVTFDAEHGILQLDGHLHGIPLYGMERGEWPTIETGCIVLQYDCRAGRLVRRALYAGCDGVHGADYMYDMWRRDDPWRSNLSRIDGGPAPNRRRLPDVRARAAYERNVRTLRANRATYLRTGTWPGEQSYAPVVGPTTGALADGFD